MPGHAHPVRPSRRSGYSLVELAIVLAVVGIVLGALWIAANTAWEYSRREQVRETIATTVANARSYFGGQAGVPSMTYDALTNLLLSVNVIPSALRRNANCSSNLCADNPWGSFSGGSLDTAGTFRVCNWSLGMASCGTSPSGISPFFGIALTGLYKKSCIALVESMSSATEPTGLVEININGTNLMASGKQIQPVSDLDVTTYCTSVADGVGVATFVYRVVAPAL